MGIGFMIVYKFLRWGRCCAGTAAIEFSLLAIPFVTLVIGIIEISLMNATATLIQGATMEASRLIRTGQVQQTGGDPEQMFKDAVCDYAWPLVNCANLQYDVQKLDSFSAANTTPDVDDEGNMQNTSFDPGGSSDVVMIRVAYNYPLITPLIGRFFSNTTNNTRFFMSTIVLETEPYEFGG